MKPVAITAEQATKESTCTRALLRHTPKFHESDTRGLAGRYRWFSIDTLSTRDSTYWRTRGANPGIVFRLWPTDSAAVAAAVTAPISRPLGPLSGAIEGFDQKEFTPRYPQIDVRRGYVHILYDARMMFDGGHRMEYLPIDVSGSWGFGGYYDTSGDGILIDDRNGKPVPSFAGYYCAFRIEP